jgi:lipopolysaccharide export system protein LptA
MEEKTSKWWAVSRYALISEISVFSAFFVISFFFFILSPSHAAENDAKNAAGNDAKNAAGNDAKNAGNDAKNAGNDAKKVAGKDAKKEQVPTIITSVSLTADNKAKTALFTGSVVAKKADSTIYADRMLVYYSEGESGSNIDKIECDGNVKLVRGDRVVTSGKMVYYAGTDKTDERAIFTDSPRAAEGKNVVTGTKMTYYMKDDRSLVENSKVFMVEKEQGTQEKKPQEKKK